MDNDKQLTPRALSKQVKEVVKNADNKGIDLEDLQGMYENRVMIADFLAIKRIPVRCKKHPQAKLDGGDFSREYSRLAAAQGHLNAFTRSATNNLLWDLDFLNDNLAAVKEAIIAEVRVELFGSHD